MAVDRNPLVDADAIFSFTTVSAPTSTLGAPQRASPRWPQLHVATLYPQCVGLMAVPTDPKKEEVSHDDEHDGFAEFLEQALDEACNLRRASEEDEMGANIATRCSLCAVALGPASEKGGQPAEVHMERGVINLHHCV